MSEYEVAVAICRALTFGVWFAFVVWYGFFRRWEETPYGRNALVTGLAMASTWFLLTMYALFPHAWILVAQFPVMAIAIATGVQRLRFLREQGDRYRGQGRKVGR